MSSSRPLARDTSVERLDVTGPVGVQRTLANRQNGGTGAVVKPDDTGTDVARSVATKREEAQETQRRSNYIVRLCEYAK